MPLETHSLEDLSRFVESVLCEMSDFEPGAFPMTRRAIVRSEDYCGIHFCLHGPRSVKLSAIWSKANNAVIFYGATGERMRECTWQQAI